MEASALMAPRRRWLSLTSLLPWSSSCSPTAQLPTVLWCFAGRPSVRDGTYPPRSRTTFLVIAHLLLKKRSRYVFVLRPHWTKHEDARSFSQNSEGHGPALPARFPKR